MATGQTLKLHQAVARALADNGVDTMFGLMGDANMFMVDSFIRECGGTFVAAAHEAGAALMAIGYGAVSGKVGICSVTHGPATVNTTTALTHGVRAMVPMVLLCGDTDIEDRLHTQNVAQREFIIAAGAGFEQLRSPRTVVEDVAIVLRRAIAERRPIALNLPLELDWKEVDYAPIRIQVPESRAIVSASEDLDKAIGIMAAARRPIVLAGRGAKSPEAKQALIRLADRLEAPLATTLKAKDLFRGEPYDLGIFGTVSLPGAAETILESDCVIAFGASLNDKTMSVGTFRKGKRIVQVNLEPAEVGKNFVPDAGLVGDPAGTADLIVHWLDEAEIPPSGFRSEEIRQRIAADVPPEAPTEIGDGIIDYVPALVRLNAILPKDRVLVTDLGRFMLKAWTTIRVEGPGAFLTTNDFGSIGLGVANGIGVSYATPGRPVVVVAGDGGFVHGGIAEFNTAVRHGIDLIVVVCNDSSYGAEHVKFRARQRDPSTIVFEWPDFAAVAIALGGEGVTVRAEADWQTAEEAIRQRSKPLLIDIRLDPDRMPPI